MLLTPDPEPIITLLKDTLINSNSSGYIIGISGGIDSAVAATLCVRAVGNKTVKGLFLPSNVTPDDDYNDVNLITKSLGIDLITVNISDIVDMYRNIPDFKDTPYLIGNLMARSRMTILYFYANLYDMIVCGTSNRTEFLLGYCTKYGDNAADVQPIIHLCKTEVLKVAKILCVPEKIIQRVPTAGLWKDQTDEGELGMSYKEIDTAINNLEKNSWKPENMIEIDIIKRIQRAGHKHTPAPHL